MTQLHAGGKFDSNSYKVSGGLHGVGVSVVNALSDWLELRVWRDGKEHFARFHHGDTAESLKIVGESGGHTGTEVRFLASTDTFSNLEYSFEILERRLRELAFLNSGVRIILIDERPAEALRSELFYEGGVKEFVKYLDRHKSSVMILLTVPVFYPLMFELQFTNELLMDPENALIWFAIVVVVATEISLITPPVGMNVFVLKGVLKDVSLGTIFRGVFPFWVADILRLALLILVPSLSLWLVGAM